MGVNFNLYRKLIVLDPFTTIIIVIIIIIDLWVILFVCFESHMPSFLKDSAKLSISGTVLAKQS